ncbi:MAG: HDOD domain-containing protein [Nitrospirales bacterium]|nr:HDOD domain-containing protein [Nitrospirales bacterium]
MQLSLPLDTGISEPCSSIFERIKTCNSLPVLSPLASKILKICQSEEASASELAHMISQDPGMAAQILFMANSGYYGGARHKVTNVMQAVTLLGFSTIANLALSFCFYRLIKDLRDTSQVGIDQIGLWRRSIFASVAGRALGEHFHYPDPELVFLGSLLQDIGVLALNEVAGDEVTRLHDKAGRNHSDLKQLELEQLGVDHSQVGAWLAQHWQLPEEFQVSILYSHTPHLFQTPEEYQFLVDSVALSGWIADFWINASQEEAVDKIKEHSQGRLTVSAEDWGPILHTIHKTLPQIASFFHTRLGNWEDIHQTYRLALKHLAPSYQPQPA